MARLKRLEVKADRLEETVDQLEEKLDGLGIQFEQVQTDIKKLGESYDAGMKRTSEEIKDVIEAGDFGRRPAAVAGAVAKLAVVV